MYLAKNISRLTGILSRLPLPKFLRAFVFKRYAALFGVNLTEIEKPLKEYSTLDSFFTRGLQSKFRPIHSDPLQVVSPCDGFIQEFGFLKDKQLIQAKGSHYALRDFLPTPFHSHFNEGFFVTLYLSPKDCHRVFAPCSFEVTGSVHIPGKLYPVKQSYIKSVPNLYVQNERLITLAQTRTFKCAVALVGALNVGSIEAQYDRSIQTNTPQANLNDISYPSPISVQKGDWTHTFHLGSTVVLLFPAEIVKSHSLSNKTIRYGEPLFTLHERFA